MVGYATVGIEIRGIPPFAKNAKDGAPEDLLHFLPRSEMFRTVGKETAQKRPQGHPLAVGDDVLAKAPIDIGGLEYAAIEELYPLFGGFIMRDCIQQVVGLNDDFECVA
jgi:hypothetical protein